MSIVTKIVKFPKGEVEIGLDNYMGFLIVLNEKHGISLSDFDKVAKEGSEKAVAFVSKLLWACAEYYSEQCGEECPIKNVSMASRALEAINTDGFNFFEWVVSSFSTHQPATEAEGQKKTLP